MNRRGLDGFSRQWMKKMKNEEGIRYRAGQQTQDQKDFMAGTILQVSGQYGILRLPVK